VVGLIRKTRERSGPDPMKTQRRRFGAEFKTRVVIEALKAQRTLNELAGAYEVHPNQIAQWKRQALGALPGLFHGHGDKQERAQEELRARLYQQIGQLQVELDWLKKKTGLGD